MAEIIRLENLSKDYVEGGQTHTVLRNVNARFDEGEFVAIRGRSGSGKSTLLNLIAGIDTPTAGDIYMDGVRVTSLSARERTLFRRDHIGFVFQFFNLIPTLTILENVMLPGELAGNQNGVVREAARGLLEKVGLAGRSEAFPDKLSGGEQQRVAIARALVHNPRLVLADEPTGNLDDKTGDAVMQLLNQMTRAAGKTLIMVTHSHKLAQQASRVFEMRDGELLTEGTSVNR
ncbi:MAG: ABC transporter ATP-binding protein [Anaerolineales bacterium]